MIMHRVAEQKEPLRTVAAAYGVSHETIRRLLRAAMKEHVQPEAELPTHLLNEVRACPAQASRTKPARPLSKATEERYLTKLNDAEADLARLQRKQAGRQELEEPESIIPNFYYVLAHLPTEYQKQSIEGQKKMRRKGAHALHCQQARTADNERGRVGTLVPPSRQN